MKKNIRNILACTLAAMMLASGAAIADGAQEPAADDGIASNESVSINGDARDVPLENAPTLDQVATSNAASAIMSRHSSFARYTAVYSYAEGQTSERDYMTALVGIEDGQALYEDNGALEYVYDGANRYMIYPDGEMGVNISLDGELKSYYDAQLAAMNLYAHHEGEQLVSCVSKNGNYVLTTEISHADYSAATGQSFDFDDSATIVTELTVDSKLLEVQSWKVSARVADGLDIALIDGSVTYDSTTLPEGYYTMAQPTATRNITLVTDPESDAAAEHVFTIAEGAVPYIIAPDGCTVYVIKNGQYVEAEDSDIPATGDVTLYIAPITQ